MDEMESVDSSLIVGDSSKPLAQKSVQFAAPQDSPTTPISSPRKREAEHAQMTFQSHDTSSSSSSAVDITPSSAQPQPASPPLHPLGSWAVKDYDTSLAVTPTSIAASGREKTDYNAKTESEEIEGKTSADKQSVQIITSPSKSTQTQILKFRPVNIITRTLSQPDLSVSDSASSLSIKGKGAIRRGEDRNAFSGTMADVSKPPKLESSDKPFKSTEASGSTVYDPKASRPELPSQPSQPPKLVSVLKTCNKPNEGSTSSAPASKPPHPLTANRKYIIIIVKPITQ